MTVRIIIIASYIVILMNFGVLLGIEGANVVEKGMFFLAALLFVASRKLVKLNIFIVALIAFIILSSALFSKNDYIQWPVLISAFNQFLIPLGLLSAVPTEKDRLLLLKMASYAPMICCALGLVYQVAGISSLFSVEYGTGIGRLQGSLIPAFLSGFALTGCVASMILYTVVKGNYLPLFFVNLVVLAAAGGRVPLLIAFVICGYLFFWKNEGAKLAKLMFIVISPGVVTFLIVGTELFSRFGESGFNGRDIMWTYMLELINQHWLFGVGFGQSMHMVPRYISVLTGSGAAHNDYLRLAAEIGIIQSVIFFVLLITAVFIFARVNGRRISLVLLGLFGFLLYSASDNVLASPSDFFVLLVCAWASGLRAPQFAESKKDSAAKCGRGEESHGHQLPMPQG